MTRPSTHSTSLLVAAGSRTFALPIPRVIETMRLLDLEPIPGAPPYVSGLSVIRGQPLPVIDLRVLVGQDPPAPPTRLVTLRTPPRAIALAVDAVRGLHRFDADALQALPPLFSQLPLELASALAMLDAELVVFLEVARLVPEAMWDELPEIGDRSG